MRFSLEFDNFGHSLPTNINNVNQHKNHDIPIITKNASLAKNDRPNTLIKNSEINRSKIQFVKQKNIDHHEDLIKKFRDSKKIYSDDSTTLSGDVENHQTVDFSNGDIDVLNRESKQHLAIQDTSSCAADDLSVQNDIIRVFNSSRSQSFVSKFVHQDEIDSNNYAKHYHDDLHSHSRSHANDESIDSHHARSEAFQADASKSDTMSHELDAQGKTLKQKPQFHDALYVTMNSLQQTVMVLTNRLTSLEGLSTLNHSINALTESILNLQQSINTQSNAFSGEAESFTHERNSRSEQSLLFDENEIKIEEQCHASFTKETKRQYLVTHRDHVNLFNAQSDQDVLELSGSHDLSDVVQHE